MTSVQTAQPPQPSASRVLVVDDEESIRDSVSTAPNGEDAVALLTREAFALVISDIRMPGISGLEVLERAKATHPGIRVVLITGFGTPQMLTRAQQSGADRILTKPFNPMELLAAVREILPSGNAETR